MDENSQQFSGAEIDPAQGFCIEISCLPDGTYNVSIEPLQSESAEPGESAGEQVSSFEDAIKSAISLYQKTSGGDDSSEFDAGFSGNPTPVSRPGMIA